MLSEKTPAQLFALIFGATLLIAGIIGFFYEPEFSSGDAASRDAVFGLLDVNGWHNTIHIASGVAGLLVFRSASQSLVYAAILGVVYLLVGLWGFALGDGEVMLGIVPVNTEDNVLHLIIAVAGIGTAALSSGRRLERGQRAHYGDSHRV